MRNHRSPLAALPLALTLAGAVPLPLSAQSLSDPPVELQETDRFGLGARAMGMGNAVIALPGDMSALGGNPAGLAGLGRRLFSAGLAIDDATTRSTHLIGADADFTETRFEHLVLVFPLPRLQRSVVASFGFHRVADLDARFFKEGYLFPASPGTPGLYEVDDYRRDGAVDAWTAAVGGEISPRISVGGAVRLLTGTSREDILQANYRATVSGNQVVLDVGDPSSPDDRLFEDRVVRHADLVGVTGSLGLLARFDPGVRVGAVLDLPASMRWDGDSRFRLEDWEKIDGNLAGGPRDLFQDDLTLPLSLAGGVSWEKSGVLLSGGVRWTDWTQIDFEGEILEPPQGVGFARESAYRSTVAVNLGAEVTLPHSPLALRAGFFTEPLPYRLIAGDTDFRFTADDGDPNTTNDVSSVLRDYPRADIRSGRKAFTLGAGLELEDALRLDAAFVHGSWERATPTGYENGTDFYPTTPTVEKETENRFFLGATARMR